MGPIRRKGNLWIFESYAGVHYWLGPQGPARAPGTALQQPVAFGIFSGRCRAYDQVESGRTEQNSSSADMDLGNGSFRGSGPALNVTHCAFPPSGEQCCRSPAGEKGSAYFPRLHEPAGLSHRARWESTPAERHAQGKQVLLGMTDTTRTWNCTRPEPSFPVESRFLEMNNPEFLPY